MKGMGCEWGDVPAPLRVMDDPGEFWVGRVVTKLPGVKDIGHIVGFSRNAMKEVLVDVVWSNGKRTPVHPTNINLE